MTHAPQHYYRHGISVCFDSIHLPIAVYLITAHQERNNYHHYGEYTRKRKHERSNRGEQWRSSEWILPMLVPSLESDMRVSAGCWISPWTDLLSSFRKRHSNEGRAQCLGVHLHSGSTQVVILPSLHIGRLVPINQPFLNHTLLCMYGLCAYVHSEVLVSDYFRTCHNMT